MTRESRAPLIVAILLLLLPVLYVGSYLALVTPQGWDRWVSAGFVNSTPVGKWVHTNYRLNAGWPVYFFWPLEQIDRKVRPGAWESGLLWPEPTSNGERPSP